MKRRRVKSKIYASDLHLAYRALQDKYHRAVTSHVNAATFAKVYKASNGQQIQTTGFDYGSWPIPFLAHCIDVPRRHNQPKGTIKALKAYCIKQAITRAKMPIHEFIMNVPETTLALHASTVPLHILPYVFHMQFFVQATIKGFFDDEYIYPFGMLHQYDADGNERRALNTTFHTQIQLVGFEEGTDIASMRSAIALVGV